MSETNNCNKEISQEHLELCFSDINFGKLFGYALSLI